MGKLLSELLRDGGGHLGRTAAASGGEQGRWHTELGQVSMELIAVSYSFHHLIKYFIPCLWIKLIKHESNAPVGYKCWTEVF